MKLGVSSHSFRPMLAEGSLTIESMFDWLAANGSEHLELSSFSFAPQGQEKEFDFSFEEDTIQRIERQVEKTGIPISGLCMAANFIGGTTAEKRAQIDLVKRHVALCNRLGAKHLRHDVVPWALRALTTRQFESEFAGIVSATREIAQFGADLDVTTSVENHGFFMNSSERLLRLIDAVDHANFKFTLDVGNFLCVDEDPHVATNRSLPHASIVHLKDFYLRRTNPGPGWLQTLGGNFIRGAVFGFGDLDAKALVKSVVESGYDGFVSLEYEAAEPTLPGCATSLANIRGMASDATK